MTSRLFRRQAYALPMAWVLAAGTILPLVLLPLPLCTEPGTAEEPQQFQGVSLPYEGPGSVWVLDDRCVIVHVGERVTPRGSGRRLAGSSAIGGTPAPETPKRCSFAFRLSDHDPVLLRTGDNWRLQAERPALRNRPAPLVVPVIARDDDECARRSLVGMRDWLRVEFDQKRNVYTLHASDARSGETLAFAFQPVDADDNDTAAPDPDNFTTVSCDILCDSGEKCSASVSCNDPPGCWAECWCDDSGHAHCETGPQEPTNITLVAVK